MLFQHVDHAMNVSWQVVALAELVAVQDARLKEACTKAEDDRRKIQTLEEEVGATKNKMNLLEGKKSPKICRRRENTAEIRK